MALKADEAAQDYVPKNIFLTGGAGRLMDVVYERRRRAAPLFA
jgi:hypothetical protein